MAPSNTSVILKKWNSDDIRKSEKMRQDGNMSVKKRGAAEKEAQKKRGRNQYETVSKERAIRPPFQDLMMNRIVHLASLFQASFRVPRHAQSRTSDRGLTSALSP